MSVSVDSFSNGLTKLPDRVFVSLGNGLSLKVQKVSSFRRLIGNVSRGRSRASPGAKGLFCTRRKSINYIVSKP